jgi:beta-lactamase regulating signal transducer with metallopeptidase domain
MSSFEQWIVSNAILASALALLVGALARFIQAPALRHALWMLVLIKLVTPPLWKLPIEVRETSAVVLPSDAAVSSRQTDIAAARRGLQTRHWPLRWIVAPFSLGGSLALLGLASWRTKRFRELIQQASPAPDSIQERIVNLSWRFGLGEAPRGLVVEACIPPLLWPLLPRSVIVLPAKLIHNLSIAEQETLLAHEIAHFRRRDHWLRWLESAIVALFWWHPVVWWARSELRQAEEDCCDAWVLWAVPNEAKSYANALLKTLDFLSSEPSPVPITACGFGESNGIKQIKRRFEMILRKRLPRQMGRRHIALVGIIALSSLPFSCLVLASRGGDGVNGDPVAANKSSGTGTNDVRFHKERLEHTKALIETISNRSGPEPAPTPERLKSSLNEVQQNIELLLRRHAIDSAKSSKKEL